MTKTRYNLQINGENDFWVNKFGLAGMINSKFSRKPAIKALLLEAAFTETNFWENLEGIGTVRLEMDEVEWDEVNNVPMLVA